MKTKIIVCMFAFLFFLCAGVAADGFKSPPEADFSDMNWTEAFEALHKKMSAEYAFSEWKNIDWVALKKKYGEIIAKAEKKKQLSAYENALKEYTLSLPDGHVAIYGGNYQKNMTADIKASYGITLASVENDRIIVNYVDETSAAAKAGIKVGAEILSWNNTKIDEQLTKTIVSSLVHNGIATDEQLALRRCQRLARDAVGSEASISYRNPSNDGKNSLIKSVRLTAYDDQMRLLNKSNFIVSSGFNLPTIEHKILSEKYGYLLIKAILSLEAIQSGETDPNKQFGAVYDKFKEVLAYFMKNNVQGLIIDLRGNAGGSDELASRLSGFFYQEKVFYERQSYFNMLTNKFELQTFCDYSDDVVDALYIEPQNIYFNKPVIAIVDPGTISSGEGVAMGIQNSANGYVIGFYGTNGSFGMTGGEVAMPEDIEIHYPYGSSLNKEGIIQLDSRNGVGGISPDFVVPMTSENAIRFAKGEDVLLEYAEKKLHELTKARTR